MTVCGWAGVGEHLEACPWPNFVADRITWLCVHGSSLCMGWDSDAEQWEVSWITSGKRTTAVRRSLDRAIERIYDVAVLGLA